MHKSNKWEWWYWETYLKISLPTQKKLIQGSISQALLRMERTQLPERCFSAFFQLLWMLWHGRQLSLERGTELLQAVSSLQALWWLSQGCLRSQGDLTCGQLDWGPFIEQAELNGCLILLNILSRSLQTLMGARIVTAPVYNINLDGLHLTWILLRVLCHVLYVV